MNDPQNEPRTCPYCDQPREDTFEHQFRFKCGTSLRRKDHNTVKQSSECKIRVDYSRLVVENTRLKCGTPHEQPAPDGSADETPTWEDVKQMSLEMVIQNFNNLRTRFELVEKERDQARARCGAQLRGVELLRDERDDLRTKLAAAQAEAGKLREALERIQSYMQRIDALPWGYDGDCGAGDIAEDAHAIARAALTPNSNG